MRWLALLVAVALWCVGADAILTIDRIEDVIIKACPTSSCTGASVQLVYGHTTEGYDRNLITIGSLGVSPPLSDAANSPIADATVTTNGGQKVITITPNGRKYGRSEITVTISAPGEASISRLFGITVKRLAPVFDDTGPSRTVVDLKTLVGTPTFPYSFLVGHEDPILVNDLTLTAFSGSANIIPNPDGGTNNAAGSIYVTLSEYASLDAASFIVGQITAPARVATIVLRPDATNFGTVSLTLRLEDGQGDPTFSIITVFVNGRPEMDKFCAYDVRLDDSLQSIADVYGMHWMTLYMLNNHTLPHPDTLVPGTRLSIGRPYIVAKGDSLYSVATRFGTTWQHIKNLNEAIILDEKNLFEGQLLCVAPDLAYLACRPTSTF